MYSSSGFGVSSTGSFMCLSGVPNSKVAWLEKGRHEGGESFTPFSPCVVSGKALVWNQKVNTLAAICLDSGVQREQLKIETSEYWFTHFAINEKYGLVGSCLFDFDGFNLLEEFQEIRESGFHTSFDLCSCCYPVKGGFLFLAGGTEFEDRDRPLFSINAEQRSAKIIARKVYRFVAEFGSDRYYAIQDQQLVCADVETGELHWSVDPLKLWPVELNSDKRVCEPINLVLHKGELFLQTSYFGVLRFCVTDGSVTGYMETLKKNLEGKPFAGKEPAFYISDDIYYQTNYSQAGYEAGSLTRAVNLESGDVVFEAASDGLEWFLFVAGDLIFFNDMENQYLLARDKYSGEQVWHSEDYASVDFGFPVANKVIFYSMMGPMLCFEWEEEYISTHRKK